MVGWTDECPSCCSASFGDECQMPETLDGWITDGWMLTLLFFLFFEDKRQRDEALYHPRLVHTPLEEDEGSGSEFSEQQSRSDGSFSPQPSHASSGASSAEESSPRRRPGPKKLKPSSRKTPQKPQQQSSERMFDDSDDDSSIEKDSNLNWTPAEVATPTLTVQTGLGRRPGAPAKEPVGGSSLINLCTTVPPGPPGLPGPPAGTRVLPAEVGSAAGSGHTTRQGQYRRKIRVKHVCEIGSSLKKKTKTLISVLFKVLQP